MRTRKQILDTGAESMAAMWRAGDRAAVLHLMRIEHGVDAAYLALAIAEALGPQVAAEFQRVLGEQE
jgi:hypothetical protein